MVGDAGVGGQVVGKLVEVLEGHAVARHVDGNALGGIRLVLARDGAGALQARGGRRGVARREQAQAVKVQRGGVQLEGAVARQAQPDLVLAGLGGPEGHPVLVGALLPHMERGEVGGPGGVDGAAVGALDGELERALGVLARLDVEQVEVAGIPVVAIVEVVRGARGEVEAGNGVEGAVAVLVLHREGALVADLLVDLMF